jgi:hypothetical protein
MNIKIEIPKTPHSEMIFYNLDGETSTGDIINRVITSPFNIDPNANAQSLLDELRTIYDKLENYYIISLRDKSLPQPTTVNEMQARINL